MSLVSSDTKKRVIRHSIPADDQSLPDENTQPRDEAALIEERRKRREAIKARHRGQATPLLVQALAPDKAASKPEAKSGGVVAQDQIMGKWSVCQKIHACILIRDFKHLQSCHLPQRLEKTRAKLRLLLS